MEISALATYRPVWADKRGRRMAGNDEDSATLAISSGRLLGSHLASVDRVVLVGRRPDALLGTTPEVVLEGLGLDPGTPLVERLGGAPETLDALLSSAPGTLVIAIDQKTPTASAAALVGPGPVSIERCGQVRHSVPVRTVPLPGAADLLYDDPRLLRERGWKRVIQGLADDLEPESLAVAGVPEQEVRRLAPKAEHGVAEVEAASPLLVLACLSDVTGSTRLVGVENGHGLAVRVTVDGALPVFVEEREPWPAGAAQTPVGSIELPASLAAYERAFEAKVGLKAGVCPCGTVHYPPRVRCQTCGSMYSQSLKPLPRAASIYSVVTVRAAVPGKTVPYSLAVVDLAGSDVRVLAHVTDHEPGRAGIGATGQLVLRRIATRAGIPDYGYAFQPEEQS
ncbi:OB-fold domain-containing protein [Nocardioides sp. S5]|uniref:Zn-ribbon domain-containing OB-fold protein n=1 Tax=Nocardioides sp. S5 TaxID=2017486 RepID=UPI001A909DDA|nr:OB-fold domain-containing protein [Nocardioides sp. S5]